MKTTAPIPATHVIVVNDVVGTKREYDAPQSPEECMANNVELSRAADYCDELALMEQCLRPAPPLSCAIRRAGRRIEVRWHSEGDSAEALDILAKLYADGDDAEGGVA